jgi:26S proteasome regulatory subunit N5
LDSTVLLAKTIISICREIGQWKILGEQISLLCKRRAQMPKVCQVVMQQAFGYITETPNDETKIELITTLREVSTGKMYVELERARMTRILAAMEEKAGRASEASALLLELTVETIGAMEVKEKAELLLEQIRLCLITKDFIRAEILMGKVTGKVLENPDLQPLKLEYHNMCESFYLRSNRYLDACRSYLAVYNTAMVKGDEKLWRPALEHAALLCILAPFGDECKNTLGRLLAEKLMDQLPGPKMLLTLFATPELIEWPLPVDSMRLNEHPLFQDCEQRAVRLNDLRTRVTQHNLRTLAAYYTTISYARASELLQLGVPQMEEALADLVSTGKLYAKIDRPAGVIAFQKKQSSSEVTSAVSMWKFPD